MNILETKSLNPSQKQQILEIWNREYPSSLSYDEEGFEKYLHKLSDKWHLLALDDQEKVVGWLDCFIRNEERFFSLIVYEKMQGKGLGSQLLNQAKERHRELNGWVVDDSNQLKANGELYKSPLQFYVKNGFEVLPDIRFENEKMKAVRVRWSLASQ